MEYSQSDENARRAKYNTLLEAGMSREPVAEYQKKKQMKNREAHQRLIEKSQQDSFQREIEHFLTSNPHMRGRPIEEIQYMIHEARIQKQEYNRQEADLEYLRKIDEVLTQKHEILPYQGQTLTQGKVFMTADGTYHIVGLHEQIQGSVKGIPITHTFHIWQPYNRKPITPHTIFQISNGSTHTFGHTDFSGYYMGQHITHVLRGGKHNSKRKRTHKRKTNRKK